MLPNFLIIGAPRAGTTWMAKNLVFHPDIFIPKVKEVHFFDTHFEKGVGFYQQFFGAANGERAIGEATPAYLFTENVPELIKKTLPEVRLIVSLRNPVDRLYSRYWNAKAKYDQNRNISFEDKIKLKPKFIEEGFYYDHLKRYYNVFPKEKVLTLFFDEIKYDPEKFLKKIYEYLEVDSNFSSPLLNIKIGGAASKGALGKIWMFEYLSKILNKFKLHKFSFEIEKRNRAQLPPMKPETREWLTKEVYYQKNELLEELIGKDLSEWKKV